MKQLILMLIIGTLTNAASAVASDLSAVAVASPTGENPTSAIDEYAIDDGTGDANLGYNGNAPKILWVNSFTVQPGLELITAIRIAWGGVPAGLPGEAMVWDDPNNDGDPTDVTSADLLASVVLVTDAGPTNTFSTYPIPAVDVGDPGDRFFVGACVDHGVMQFPALLDMTPPNNGRSWVTGCLSCDPKCGGFMVKIDGEGFPGDWMVRANATGAVPVMENTWGSIKATYTQ